MNDKPGPTGNFPLGKLVPGDEGELNMQLGMLPNGIIVLDFGGPVKWIGVTSVEARDLAAKFLELASRSEALAKKPLT